MIVSCAQDGGRRLWSFLEKILFGMDQEDGIFYIID